MEFFRSAPFIRILPAFCTGVYFSFFTKADPRIFYVLLFVNLTGIFIQLRKKKIDYGARYYTGIHLQLIFISFGFILCEINNPCLFKSHFSKIHADYFMAELTDQPSRKSSGWRCEAKIDKVFSGRHLISAGGKCYIYFSDSCGLSCGDKIIFKKSPSIIEAPLNPGMFDFKYYSSLQRIYHQVRVHSEEWKLVGHNETIKSLAIKLRTGFLKVYEEAGLSGQELAVMSALVLGYDDDIDKSTMAAFTASGTLHVLSVSGMHVGIIFTALSFILKFAEKKKSLRILRLIVLIISLWFYAFLTGLSPSVIRSAMMFTFILVGKSFDRSLNIYNSLALSALVIFFLFDPVMLFQPGLQLSYIAVAGIAFFYPKIYKIFYFENSFVDKIYSLIAVSLAAQIATFPISIYYFHQFPNYFILANLVIIPLSTIAIFGGISLLFLTKLTLLSAKIGWCCAKVVWLLNESAIFIEHLPGSVWTGLLFRLSEVFALTIFSIILTWFLGTKYFKALIYSLSVFIVFISLHVLNLLSTNMKQKIIFFSEVKNMACQFCNGSEIILFTSQTDSAKALRFSDAYGILNGYDSRERKIVILDSTNKYNSRYVIANDGRQIIIGNLSVIIDPDKDDSISDIHLIYLNKKRFFTSSNEIIINDYGKNQDNNNFRAENYLSSGAKIFTLN